MLIVLEIFVIREEGEGGTILVSLLNRVSRAVLQFGNKVEPANGKQKLFRVNGSSSQWGSTVFYSCISFYMVLVNMLFYCYISRMFMRAGL